MRLLHRGAEAKLVSSDAIVKLRFRDLGLGLQVEDHRVQEIGRLDGNSIGSCTAFT